MNDIFTIDSGVEYDFYLTGGIMVTGNVIEVYENGLVLSDGTRLVQAHITMFVPKKIVGQAQVW